jgi:archaellum biogenesis ATPase FlaH
MAKEAAKKFDLTKFMSIDDLKDETESLNFVPIAPNLDLRFGGGVQEASFLLMRTLPKVGKSTLLSCFARNSVKQKRHTFLFDTETRWSKRNVFRLAINEEEYELMRKYLHIEQLKRDSQFKTGNDVYEFIFQQMQKPAMDGSVFIVDSFSKILPREHLDDPKVRADRRDSTPKLNADFCKKIGNLLRSSRSILVGVQHFNNDPNKWGNSLSAVGGLKFDYDADYVLEALHEPQDLEGIKQHQILKIQALNLKEIEFAGRFRTIKFYRR